MWHKSGAINIKCKSVVNALCKLIEMFIYSILYTCIYIACYYVVAMCYISYIGSYRPVYSFADAVTKAIVLRMHELLENCVGGALQKQLFLAQ